MLFDSAQSDHPNSRFDILVRQPLYQITMIGGELHTSFTLPEGEQSDFFAAMQAAIARVPPIQAPTELSHHLTALPFLGGAMGYLGYDLARSIEKLPEQASSDIQLPEAAMGIYHHALIIDHQQQLSFIVAPADWSQAQAELFWTGTATPQAPFKLLADWQSNMSKAHYLARVERIHEYLRAGDCYQINLAQRFQAPCEGSSWHAYQKLRASNRAPFSGFICLPQGNVLSLSPERFLRVSARGEVETKPIKGTLPRSLNPHLDRERAEQLQQSSKDRAENLMIVDLLRNDLSRVCVPGSVQVPALFQIESFPAVHHLVSTVIGSLDTNQDAIDLMRAAFPGGSITGAPKVRAMEIIEELEPHRRSIYCGSFAYFSQHGHSDSSITIRTLCHTDGHIYCWAGGGIVMDSEASKEYQETLDKVAKILPILESD